MVAQEKGQGGLNEAGRWYVAGYDIGRKGLSLYRISLRDVPDDCLDAYEIGHVHGQAARHEQDTRQRFSLRGDKAVA